MNSLNYSFALSTLSAMKNCYGKKQKRSEQKKDVDNRDEDRLNALLAEGRIFCDMPALADRDSILIRDTCHENSLMCQPQQRIYSWLDF